jgi:hypothetical protein
MVPGVELVGKIPAELQTYLTFTAGVGVAPRSRKPPKRSSNISPHRRLLL